MQNNLDRLRRAGAFAAGVAGAHAKKGVSREDSYRLVQRNAMPVWRGEGDFLTLLKADPEVSAKMSDDEIAECFDLG